MARKDAHHLDTLGQGGKRREGLLPLYLVTKWVNSLSSGMAGCCKAEAAGVASFRHPVNADNRLYQTEPGWPCFMEFIPASMEEPA